MQTFVRFFQILCLRQRFVDGEGEQLWQGTRVSGVCSLWRALDALGGLTVAAATADGTGDLHVWQKLHVHGDLSGAVALAAAQTPGVIRKIAGFPACFLGLRNVRIGAAQFVHHTGVGGDGGAHICADRGGIDEIDAADAFGFDAAHMCWRRCLARQRLQSGYEAFEDERRFTAARNAGDAGESSFWNLERQRADCV